MKTITYDEDRGTRMTVDELILKLRNDAQISDFTAVVAADQLELLRNRAIDAESERDELKSKLERTERNRDMYKTQVETQVVMLEKLRSQPIANNSEPVLSTDSNRLGKENFYANISVDQAIEMFSETAKPVTEHDPKESSCLFKFELGDHIKISSMNDAEYLRAIELFEAYGVKQATYIKDLDRNWDYLGWNELGLDIGNKSAFTGRELSYSQIIEPKVTPQVASMRAEFENLCVSKNFCSKDYSFKINTTSGKPNLGEYEWNGLERMWQGFKMARQSQKI